MSKEDLYSRGMERFAEGRIGEAVEAYRRALSEDPAYADALHALAMAYAADDKLDEAIETGKKLVEICPDDELAYTSLSIFCQRKGLIAEAESHAAKARTLGWKRQLQERSATKKEPK